MRRASFAAATGRVFWSTLSTPGSLARVNLNERHLLEPRAGHRTPRAERRPGAELLVHELAVVLPEREVGVLGPFGLAQVGAQQAVAPVGAHVERGCLLPPDARSG